MSALNCCSSLELLTLDIHKKDLQVSRCKGCQPLSLSNNKSHTFFNNKKTFWLPAYKNLDFGPPIFFYAPHFSGKTAKVADYTQNVFGRLSGWERGSKWDNFGQKNLVCAYFLLPLCLGCSVVNDLCASDTQALTPALKKIKDVMPDMPASAGPVGQDRQRAIIEIPATWPRTQKQRFLTKRWRGC